MSGPPNPILTPQILATAFHDLSQGQESDVIEVGRGESYAVRVERVLPPAVPPLAEVRDIVARQYMMQAMARQLREHNLRYGIAAACVGGGQGMALLIENPGWCA